MGLTGLHDFDRRRCFSALQLLHEQGQLHLRVTKSIPLEDLPSAVTIGLRSGFGDNFLRIGSVKAFADGALGPHSAAMFQPYEDEPQNLGILILDAEELLEHGRVAVDHGLSLAVHAIGDRAVHEVLDAYTHIREYETSLEQDQSHRLRHRLEHVQVIHPADTPRLADLGIIASMQPIHATSDMQMADRFWGKRSALAYAWRTQLNHGACLAFGSDAPVESPNPFWGLHAAVTRCQANGNPGPDGWYPEQRITLHEALQAFTIGAAYASGQEDCLGKLAPGFLADLLILDKDIFRCEPAQIKDIRPTATMVGGAWVWQS
jgi:predicted amidohydrolase YtcJ